MNRNRLLRVGTYGVQGRIRLARCRCFGAKEGSCLGNGKSSVKSAQEYWAQGETLERTLLFSWLLGP